MYFWSLGIVEESGSIEKWFVSVWQNSKCDQTTALSRRRKDIKGKTKYLKIRDDELGSGTGY